MSLFAVSMFQQTALVVVGLLFLGSVVALIKGWANRREGLIWSAVWLAAGVAVLWPRITSKIARGLGIGRGADLVFYCAVIVMMIGFWLVYIRLRRVRREITLLVRHLATLEAEQGTARRDGDRKTPESPERLPRNGPNAPTPPTEST